MELQRQKETTPNYIATPGRTAPAATTEGSLVPSVEQVALGESGICRRALPNNQCILIFSGVPQGMVAMI